MRNLIAVSLILFGTLAGPASAQHRSQAGRGALIGGLIGAGVGGAFAIAVGDGSSTDSPGWVAPAGFVGTTALGALIGLAIGAQSGGDARSELAVHESVAPGVDVRVRHCVAGPADRCTRARGSLVAASDESITVRDASGVERTLPWTGETDVRYAAGRRGNALRGALGGALVGGGVGLAGQGRCAEMCGIYPAIGLGSGLLLGALVGSLIHSDRWEAATPQHREPVISMIAAPSGAPGAGLRIAF